ncbi:MAG TPA: cytochrome c-type biogenesis protein CcmH [Solirubrobacteraceae bacterium]|jgi:cytochrome c-type biogenesis protein CcmH|nr:cytochrome c-type biogenesis protein CcmH [Solirubrobacteraceae bacterium]
MRTGAGHTTRGVRSLAALLAVLALALLGEGAALAAARASLPQIERQVMCVTCKIPLNVAESPQADRERAYIQLLIDRGYTEAGVKHALVGQYGAAVLGLPPDHGVGLAAYLVPLVAVLALAAVLAVLLPRWRRRSGTGGGGEPPAPLAPADAARLESDLARFD